MAGEMLEGAGMICAVGQAVPMLQARGVLAPEELPLMRALRRVVEDGQATDLVVDGFIGQEAFVSGR